MGSLTASNIGEACVCLGLRRAARLIARRYDMALKPMGITSGQFSILAALMRDEAVPLGSLAEAMGLDRTTLSRNLGPLESRKLVETATQTIDQRVRGLRLTAAGRRKLEKAIPLWQQAQAVSNELLGNETWPKLGKALRKLN